MIQFVWLKSEKTLFNTLKTNILLHVPPQESNRATLPREQFCSIPAGTQRVPRDSRDPHPRAGL